MSGVGVLYGMGFMSQFVSQCVSQCVGVLENALEATWNVIFGM